MPKDMPCDHRRYSVDTATGEGRCMDCGAEGRMRFVVGDTQSMYTAGMQDGIDLSINICREQAKRWPDDRASYAAHECALAIWDWARN